MRVHVRGGGEGIEADAVLITVPLGVLKARSVTFKPPLPPWKRQAIERLGFGPIEKVVLLFEKRFWEEGVDFFGCLPPSDMGQKSDELTSRRGEFFLFWNLERSHGIPALICISSGQFADRTWRQHSYKGVVNKALAVLRRTFGTQVNSLFKRSSCRTGGATRTRAARTRTSPSPSAAWPGRDYDALALHGPSGCTRSASSFAGEHTNVGSIPRQPLVPSYRPARGAAHQHPWTSPRGAVYRRKTTTYLHRLGRPPPPPSARLLEPSRVATFEVPADYVSADANAIADAVAALSSPPPHNSSMLGAALAFGLQYQRSGLTYLLCCSSCSTASAPTRPSFCRSSAWR